VKTLKPSIALERHRDVIRQIVARHHGANPRVFGSVLKGDDRPDSDLDILIDPTPETTLFDIGAIRHELLQTLGVPVDVLTPGALPDKIRDTVLVEAKAI
jgi:predicted nucleotidyltransferase